MAFAIRLPDMGTNVEECKLLAWRVREGERVNRGQVLAEIETDKAVAELESTAEGVLLRHEVKAGEPARTGDVLAYVGQPGEPVPDQTPSASEANVGSPGAAVMPPSPVASSGPTAPPRASPVVRNLAAKLGVDLATVRGTGTGGVITREDVLLASQATPPGPGSGEALSRAQAAVARAVEKSWKEIPRLAVSITIDMAAAQKIRAESASERRPSYDAIFLKAMAKAIEAVPRFAARLDGERVVRAQGIHIALAVGLENDLFLPVVRDVDQKDLRRLQAEISELASKVGVGAMKSEQLTGGCMALSNLGMYPVDAFEAIIFPGHSAILAVGSAQKRPVVVEDRVEVRPLVTATLSADHRLINGRTAAKFLTKLKETIESGDMV